MIHTNTAIIKIKPDRYSHTESGLFLFSDALSGIFSGNTAYTNTELNQRIDFFRQSCYIRLSDRTGETCEASGPEGSCGGLSLFITKGR